MLERYSFNYVYLTGPLEETEITTWKSSAWEYHCWYGIHVNMFYICQFYLYMCHCWRLWRDTQCWHRVNCVDTFNWCQHYFLVGNLWNERNDWIAMGNIITWSRWGEFVVYSRLLSIDDSCSTSCMMLLLRMIIRFFIRTCFKPASCWYPGQSLVRSDKDFVLFRVFVLGGFLFLSVRKYYLLQAMGESHCPRAFCGFFWLAR